MYHIRSNMVQMYHIRLNMVQMYHIRTEYGTIFDRIWYKHCTIFGWNKFFYARQNVFGTYQKNSWNENGLRIWYINYLFLNKWNSLPMCKLFFQTQIHCINLILERWLRRQRWLWRQRWLRRQRWLWRQRWRLCVFSPERASRYDQ